MNRAGLPESLRLTPLLIGFALALFSLAVTALAALFVAHDGIPEAAAPLGNLSAVAHSYLFRNALWNTAMVVAAVFATVYAIARITLPQSAAAAGAPRLLFALAITPLFLPAPFSVILWRPVLANVDVVQQPAAALAAVALIQVWRLWPLALLAGLISAPAWANRTSVAVALAAAWIVWVDVGTPLTATGGEPFNETHLAPTWSFHTLWVSGQWGHGAVMVGVLGLISALLGALFWRAVRNVRPPEDRPGVGDRSAASMILAGAGAVLTLAPLALTIQVPVGHGLAQTASELGQAGYWRWVANSAAVLCVASLIAALIVMPLRASGTARRQILLAASFIAGVSVVPIWVWIGLRFGMQGSGSPGLLLSGIAAGVCTGLISARTTDMAFRRPAGPPVAALVAVAALLVANQFALEIVVAGSRESATLAAGTSLYLAGSWSHALAPTAAVLTFLITAGVLSAVTEILGTRRGKRAVEATPAAPA